MAKNPIEMYVHYILIALATVIGVCFIALSIQHGTAQKLHASIIQDIEASNFSETVIQELVTDVNDTDGDIQKVLPGCELTINSVRNDGQDQITSPNGVIDEVAEVKLTYYYEAFIFIKPLKYELIGYAR